MRYLTLLSVLWASFLILQPSSASSTSCPVTKGVDGPYVDGWPDVQRWYGSKDLALMLPEYGTWPTTKPGHLISVKLFWYIDGFESGQETDFVATIKRLDDGEADAKISQPTNAGGSSLGAATVLTGIDFPSEGCWQITGEFHGSSLSFVVQTEIPWFRRPDAA